ncbi:DUF4013 domain-containing protein [Haloprofundus halobius]|uniref:DUF4013 domain-containing protein n=1 Tax=Haloprofundus halobius TaxID=2876194 RepID=UPI001CCBE3DB|nr:DUF4013 domain-containing protein [Haloprofundus halobius]
MLRDALNAPARTTDAVQTLFLGGFLTLLAFLLPLGWLTTVATVPFLVVALPVVFLPSLLLRGYYVRTMQAGLRGAERAPSFVRWGELVRDGLRSYFVAFIYLVPVIVLWTLVGVTAVAVELRPVGGPTGSMLVTLSAASATLLSGLYLPVFAYLFPAALVTYAATGRLTAAFAPRAVSRTLLDGGYAKGWVLASGVLVVALAVGAPTSLFLVGVFVVFYLQTVVHSVYGLAARTALGAELDDDGRVRVERAQRRPEVEASVQVGRSVGLTDGRGSETDSPADGEIRDETEVGADRNDDAGGDDNRSDRDGPDDRRFERGERGEQ